MASGNTGLLVQIVLRISHGENESIPATTATTEPIKARLKRFFSARNIAAPIAASGKATSTRGAAVYLTPAARPAINPAIARSLITLVFNRNARRNHAAASDS